ncbi:alpha/beta hydrolase [Rhodococcus sp. X156]|uniref:alpha/beta hydrolase n=1 Tax=Rhodococcus sp. X156 TaxID=2499145 RepID=UPI000FDAE59B|nr:alpha/beta hydrolase [Rhodococcus sp. X156]
MTDWEPDVLGADYQQLVLPLGTDPDGESPVVATLVRHATTGAAPRGAFLHVHGYTDYFFQTGLAEHLTALGYAFYALDLRKCGRSIRPGQMPHFVSDLALYDAELDEALRIVQQESGGDRVVVGGHSTGGLVVPLWLDRRRQAGLPAPDGLVLNSPWFDLQGPAYYRSAAGTALIDTVGRLAPKRVIPVGSADAYGTSLHRSGGGEWDYDLSWKPLVGFPARFGWMRAVRHGQAALHRGLDVGCSSLLLRSTRSHFATAYSPDVDTADAVLDVHQIARWAGCLGGRTLVAPIDGARHDVFLSQAPAREAAYAELDAWLAALHEQVDLAR